MADDHCEPDMTIADQVRTSVVLTAAFTGLLKGIMTANSPNSSPKPLKTTSKNAKKAVKDENSCEGNCGCGSDSSENDTSKMDKK